MGMVAFTPSVSVTGWSSACSLPRSRSERTDRSAGRPRNASAGGAPAAKGKHLHAQARRRTQARMGADADLSGRLRVTLKDGLPIMYWRMLGTWEGRYTVMNAQAGTIAEGGGTGRFENTARGNEYSQRNTYTNDDGSVVTRDFFGLFVEGELKIDSLRVKGVMRFLDDSTAVLNAYLKADGAQFVETWRLLDEDHRTRTWHVYRNGQCTKIIHAQEVRLENEFTYFENDGQLELDFS